MEHADQNVTMTGEPETVASSDATAATEVQTAASNQDAPPDALQTLLDGLTQETPTEGQDTPQATSERPRGPDGRFAATETAQAGKTEQAAADQVPSPPQTESPPLSAEATEEAELLAGVTSERTRARFKETLAQRREAENSLNEIREMVNTTGMMPSDFAQLLEFGRLINAQDATSRQSALAMVETVRSNLCQQLGVEAPGVDVLTDFPDLAQAVQQMELSRERAVEIAKLRRDNQAAQHAQQWESAQHQQQQQFEQALATGQQAMTEYLNQRKQDADHPARMKAVQAYFQQPANIQQFVTTYEPHQWASAIQLLYDAVRAAPAKTPAPPTQPLRTKPNAFGTLAPASLFEQLAQKLSAIGI